MTLSSLFGLGWGIGLLATQDIYSNKTVHDIVAALFILLTTFHGVFIFTMHCLRSEKVKTVWKKWFFGVIGRNFVNHKDDTTFSKDATVKSKSTSETKDSKATLKNKSTSGIKEATLKSVPAVDSSIEETVDSHSIETSFT